MLQRKSQTPKLFPEGRVQLFYVVLGNNGGVREELLCKNGLLLPTPVRSAVF
jgi:hypothetical protein